jgi:hypothetical protein
MVYRRRTTAVLIAVSTTAGVAGAQSTMPPEFTAECGDCTYKLTFDTPGATDVHYELALPDPSKPAGLRRVYKGASSSAYITVRGAKTASLRACYYPSNCSGWTEITLIPPPDEEGRQAPEFNSVPAIKFLHPAGAENPGMNDLPSENNARPVVVDLSATGQRACTGGVGTRQWNLGTSMIVSLSPDTELKVINSELVEHRDGRWTWSGEIEGDDSGSVALTADDCEETVYVSIRSNKGRFAIRPTAPPHHAVYKVALPADQRQHCTAVVGTAKTLLKIVPAADGSATADQVEIETTRLDRLLNSLQYLIGEDRNHELADFIDTVGSVELVPGAPAQFDLRDGTMNVSASGDMYWTGCLAGEPNGRLRLTVTGTERAIHLVQIRDGDEVSLRKTEAGYRIETNNRSK